MPTFYKDKQEQEAGAPETLRVVQQICAKFRYYETAELSELFSG
jgi:hypothetical protein